MYLSDKAKVSNNSDAVPKLPKRQPKSLNTFTHPNPYLMHTPQPHPTYSQPLLQQQLQQTHVQEICCSYNFDSVTPINEKSLQFTMSMQNFKSLENVPVKTVFYRITPEKTKHFVITEINPTLERVSFVVLKTACLQLPDGTYSVTLPERCWQSIKNRLLSLSPSQPAQLPGQQLSITPKISTKEELERNMLPVRQLIARTVPEMRELLKKKIDEEFSTGVTQTSEQAQTLPQPPSGSRPGLSSGRK